MNKIIIIGTCGECPNFRPSGYPVGYGHTDRPMCAKNPEHVYKDNWHTKIPDSCPLTSVTSSQEETKAELEAEQFEPEISQGLEVDGEVNSRCLTTVEKEALVKKRFDIQDRLSSEISIYGEC